MKILVTGASGFIGRALVSRLCELDDLDIIAVRRSPGLDINTVVQYAVIGDVNDQTDWSAVLHGVEVVIHLAALAHGRGNPTIYSENEFLSVNVYGSLNLAKQAAEAGVKRFIFLSSIGVNGSCTFGDSFSELHRPAPCAGYSVSKMKAEQGLHYLAKSASMELVVIRPPLVYAGHAPGNFKRLLRAVSVGLPLPFALVRNQRSLIALDNLVDFIMLCVSHPSAANELFLISDGVDVSTPEIIRYIASGMGSKAHLVPVPESLMRYAAKLIGKENAYTQLCGSLVIDSSKAKTLLGWSPLVHPEHALVAAGRNYKG